jgi:predicted  nucleic acid-binding Zn-ribbon protein
MNLLGAATSRPVSFLAAVLATSIGAFAAPPLASAAVQHAEDLLVVDCLLPGQVRRLGQAATFLSARRPIRTTQADCAIRGGEYVAYDRADYRSALQVWMASAESGDADAQNYVGEIYLKGLGTAPDPARAADWFERAVAQGHRRAMANLAVLLEQGRGVAVDRDRALQLYRASSGASEELMYASVVAVQLAARDATIAGQRSELQQLRSRVTELEAELAQRRSALSKAESETSTLRAQLADARARAAVDDAELARQRSALDDAQARLLDLQAQLAARELRVEQRERAAAALAAVEVDAGRENALDEQRARAQQAAQAARADALALQQDLQAQSAQLAALRQQYESRIAELEQGLEASRREDWSLMKLLEGQLAEREQAMRSQQLEIAALQGELGSRTAVLAQAQPPQLQIISPTLSLTRGAGAAARSAGNRQAVLGRVSDPRRIEQVTVNQVPVVLADNGLFQASVDVPASGAEVSIVALGIGGERAELQFSLLSAPSAGGSTAQSRRVPAGLKLGRFHALVIGNNRYTDAGFAPLQSAVEDATAVAAVLRERYGHQTRLLLNASRLDILSALAELRGSLKPEDNLLVYYAGHGELGADGREGFWIPVDARAGQPQTWVANRMISDLLEQMPAQRVMVVADSCYAGALADSALPSFAASEPGMGYGEWVRELADSKARMVLTSGGLQPVPDRGSGRHSYFARAFLNVLQDNNRLIEGARLYREINSALALAALDAPLSQVPQYAPIQFAGHEAGEFFLQPKR